VEATVSLASLVPKTEPTMIATMHTATNKLIGM
jgi:hypothetical protein